MGVTDKDWIRLNYGLKADVKIDIYPEKKFTAVVSDFAEAADLYTGTFNVELKIERDGKKIKLTAMPAQHGSCTSVADYHRSLWMGIMIEVNGLRFYYAGDTGFNRNHLEEVKKHFGPIDVALLPIAPEGEPEMHLGHKQALDAFERLGAKKLIPIHYGAYRMGAEKIEDPLKMFLQAAQQRGLTDKIVVLKLGETVEVAKVLPKREWQLPEYLKVLNL